MSRRLAKERETYAKRRLAKLRTVCPDLPDDVLERVNLRQLSFSVRRIAKLRGRAAGKEAASEGVRSKPEETRPVQSKSAQTTSLQTSLAAFSSQQ